MSNLHPRLAVVLAALVVLGGLPAVAVAQQTGSGPGDGSYGGVVRVDAGETRNGDVEAAAGSVIIAGTVRGDVSAAAGSVLITDTGRVTGSLDAAAGSVVVAGVVDGDVSVGAAALEVRDGARIGGSLEAGVADARLYGAVDGDASVGADTLTVGPDASIGGSLTYDAETVTIDEDASIAGSVTRDENLSIGGPDVFGTGGGPVLPQIPGWVGSLYGAVVNLLLGVILLAAMPGFGRRVVGEAVGQPLRSGGIGLLTIILVPIVLLIVLITIVGIPLSLAGLIAFALVLWVASVYGAIAVGTWALSLADYANRWVALLVGVILVAIVGAVPVLGGLLEFVVLLVGLGAFVAAVRGSDLDVGDEGSVGDVTADVAPTE